MRPRVFPAEDISAGETEEVAARASMRPRVFPAEDFTKKVCSTRPTCFNEAAGIPRGRPRTAFPVNPTKPLLQ